MIAAMSMLEKQLAIVREFADLPDWEARYKRIIAIGRALDALPEELRDDEHKVRGCASNVWLHAERADDGHVRYRADSDAMIVRGLVALLVRVYDDESPADILATEPLFIDELELAQHLSSNRANGLASMVQQIKQYAAAFKLLDERN